MAHCWFCEKVKGKRSCPARAGALICTRCCGTNRVVAIRCPPDCVYLHGTHDPKWSSESREKESARFFTSALALDERPAQFYLFLHFVLALTKNPLAELDDGELGEVARATASTLETRAKGVLYSHPTERLHLQPAAAWLARLIELREKMPEAPVVSDADTAVSVRALSKAVEDHIGEAGRERYLSKLKRLFTKGGSASQPLTLPEGLDEPPKSRIVTP